MMRGLLLLLCVFLQTTTFSDLSQLL